jgi:hypothetical protein
MSGSGIPNCSTREFTAPFRIASEETQPFSFIKNDKSNSILTPHGYPGFKGAVDFLSADPSSNSFR